MEGYEIPLHRSLTEPILMGGAPRSAAILIAAKADPDFLSVAIRSIKHKGFLS